MITILWLCGEDATIDKFKCLFPDGVPDFPENSNLLSGYDPVGIKS